MLDKNQVINDIRKAKEIADFVIVFPHWGTEYVYEPDDYQKKWTDLFSLEEVDLVIGTHPHVLQPIEWVTSETGHKMLVYYSLGNYVSYQKEAPRMLGGMAHITLVKENDKVYINESSITPIITHYENEGNYHYGVYKLEDYTLEQSHTHGVLELQKSSDFSLAGTVELAKKVLKEWYR
jgi:poly-gamma-glutamate capsule biosynthesis protein CapA/YwtB (metallophosphatase superfamily)